MSLLDAFGGAKYTYDLALKTGHGIPLDLILTEMLRREYWDASHFVVLVDALSSFTLTTPSLICV